MSLNLDMSVANSFGLSKSQSVNTETIYDHLIIGGGPAGMNAGLYAKRKGIEVGILAGYLGGQLVNTSEVDNYLGLSSISGLGMVETFKDHLGSLEVPYEEGIMVTDIEKSGDIFHINTDGGDIYKARTVLLATGSNPRRLGVKGEAEFAGRGVAYCAICDAPFYRGRDVIIAGGGNSAVEAAVDLAKIAKSVTVVHRSQFRADQVLIDQMNKSDKVTVYLETQIEEILGDDVMRKIRVLDKQTNKHFEIEADGIFIEIGNIPNSEMFKGLVDMNKFGEIIVNEKNETSLPGIYAAGDITDGPYKQIITAVSDGAKAALSANEYLNQQVDMTDKQSA